MGQLFTKFELSLDFHSRVTILKETDGLRTECNAQCGLLVGGPHHAAQHEAETVTQVTAEVPRLCAHAAGHRPRGRRFRCMQ